MKGDRGDTRQERKKDKRKFLFKEKRLDHEKGMQEKSKDGGEVKG